MSFYNNQGCGALRQPRGASSGSSTSCADVFGPKDYVIPGSGIGTTSDGYALQAHQVAEEALCELFHLFLSWRGVVQNISGVVQKRATVEGLPPADTREPRL